MAWMRMMGADSVEYHEATVAGRGDDPVIAAAAYYPSRGGTPMGGGGQGGRLGGLEGGTRMVCGGQGCRLVGWEGEVDLADYRAVFGSGGACDPRTGARLVGCRRP